MGDQEAVLGEAEDVIRVFLLVKKRDWSSLLRDCPHIGQVFLRFLT